MQPDLPWNVAGIPPEAREAARAAARREGLSVGEWLTRKILRTLTEAAGGRETTNDSWRNAVSSSAAAYRTVADSAAAATRDTEDMLARVSRSEDESQSATRRIEDHLKGVARRLDAAERSQAENNRVMSKAAAEINIAAREQAQAFDQLDSHVMALADRLTRVEQHASGTGLKDAVKGLHTGLSRLADQIAETANQSANQIATLAQNVEALAGRLSQARHDAETTSRALKDHLVSVDERVKTIERNEGPSQALSELRTTLERLNARHSESDAQTGGAMARLEETVSKLESRVEESSVNRRLQGIEQALSDLTGRYDHNARSATEALEESLRDLTERMESADRQHRRDLEELRTALKAAEAARTPPPPAEPFVQPATVPASAPFAHGAPFAQAAPPLAPPPPAAEFDLPPFPHAQAMPPFPQPAGDPPGFAQMGANAFAPPPPFDPAPGFAAEQNFSGVQQFDTTLGNGFDTHAVNGTAFQQPQYGPGATAQSYIAATRRSARSTTDGQTMAQAAPAGFSWGASTPSPENEEGARSRYVLIGGIAVILAAALVAGAMLFRTAATPPQPIQPAVHQAAEPPVDQAPSIAHPTPAPVVAPPAAEAPPASGSTMDTAASKAESAAAAPVTQSAPAKPAAAAKPTKDKPQPTAQTAAAVSPMDRLELAAKAGSVVAETVLGLKYLDGNGIPANEAEAARWLERAAKQGQPVAEYRLGTLYERGHGVPSDAKQAATWYEAAAKLGNRKAMHNLAVAYAQGAGVNKNFTLAAQWFTRAATLGLRDSQFNLAVLYERGMGVPQSLTDAYKWYAVAAALGDTESKARVAALSTQLGPDDRAAAQRSADAFRPTPLDRAANVAPTEADL